MRIGILVCDSVPESIETDFPDYPEMFSNMFADAGCTLEFTTYDIVNHQFPEDINECDAYITTGSRCSVNDELSWITELIEFVHDCKRNEKKFVGICFGHQLLAKALGGKVYRSEKGWGIGVSKNRILNHKSWMSPGQDTFYIVVSHEDQVIEVPDEASVLSSNSHCSNFIIQFDRNLLGIQGHPEFDNQYSRALMVVNAAKIPAERLETGLESLVSSPDTQLIAKWICNFFIT